MKLMMKAAAVAALTVLAAAAGAAPLKLTPANPQPSGLKPGLAVTYAYPQDVKTLAEASSAHSRSAASAAAPFPGWTTATPKRGRTP